MDQETIIIHGILATTHDLGNNDAFLSYMDTLSYLYIFKNRDYRNPCYTLLTDISLYPTTPLRVIK